MPSLHNPTGAHMPEERRRAVAAIARRHRVRIVEDDIYGFLVDGGPAPLVSHAPELGYYLVSLSKSMAPGLRVSYAVVPRDQVPAIAASVHATAYMTAPLMAEIAARWIGDGTGARLVETYRREAIVRRVLTREALRGFTYAAHPAGFHGILTLPEPWSPTAFVTELRQRGVVLSPSTAFAAGPTAPAFVRLCLACTQERDELTYALRIVADLAKETPQAHLAVV
jgi:DNA-binding transcriptional MocR family regulator